MLKFGLVGERLGHSLSPQIHEMIFKELDIKAQYDLLEVPAEKLQASIVELAKTYNGINVTIPHKVNVMAAMTTITQEVQAIGAINTVHFLNGERLGYNTDYMGFGKLLEYNKLDIEGKTVAILGTGGVSRAVIQYLVKHNVGKIFLASRHPQGISPYMLSLCRPVPTQFIHYTQLLHQTGDLIINCTPLGMFPNVEESPVDEEICKKFTAAIDLIYNPAETLFLKQAACAGCQTANGLLMLVAQAIAAEEIWLKQAIPPAVTLKIVDNMKECL